MYRNHSSTGLMRQKQQYQTGLLEDSSKLKLVIENCSKFTCNNCDKSLTYPEFLKHVETGIVCEKVKDQKENEQPTQESQSNKRKKSRNRDSCVFKNSFIENNHTNSMHQKNAKKAFQINTTDNILSSR